MSLQYSHKDEELLSIEELCSDYQVTHFTVLYRVLTLHPLHRHVS